MVAVIVDSEVNCSFYRFPFIHSHLSSMQKSRAHSSIRDQKYTEDLVDHRYHQHHPEDHQPSIHSFIPFSRNSAASGCDMERSLKITPSDRNTHADPSVLTSVAHPPSHLTLSINSAAKLYFRISISKLIDSYTKILKQSKKGKFYFKMESKI